MIIKLLLNLFKFIIADIPEEKKKEYLAKFEVLMKEVVKSAAEGAIKGASK